ncbi:MAG: lysophospholipid acyltransferase family protein [Nostocoides sp.]
MAAHIDDPANLRGTPADIRAARRRINPLPTAYRLAVGVVRPALMSLTKRDWSGQENLPVEGGFLAAANHVTHADPLPFAHFLFDAGVDPYFLGKHSIFAIPLVGSVLRGAQQIPVFRESGQAKDAFDAAVEAVQDGKCIAIYPEGTLTRDPRGWPMVPKSGAARIALATRCPVIPIGQWGAGDVLGPYGRLPHLFPRKTLRFRAGPPVNLTDLYGRGVDAEVLGEASRRIIEAITDIVADLRGQPAPTSRFDARSAGLPPTGNPNRKERPS